MEITKYCLINFSLKKHLILEGKIFDCRVTYPLFYFIFFYLTKDDLYSDYIIYSLRLTRKLKSIHPDLLVSQPTYGYPQVREGFRIWIFIRQNLITWYDTNFSFFLICWFNFVTVNAWCIVLWFVLKWPLTRLCG